MLPYNRTILCVTSLDWPDSKTAKTGQNDWFILISLVNFEIDESPEAAGTPPVCNSGTFISLGD